MNIAIVGLGYVGTVSAACLAASGHYVWGVDINPDKVASIEAGISPIVENDLTHWISETRNTGHLHATCDIESALQYTDVCFVAVATPSRANGEIDPTHLIRACRQIESALVNLRRRQIIVVRSSILPSILDSCKEIFETRLAGQVSLAVNPEFLREGTAVRDFSVPPFTLLGVEDPSVEQTLRTIYHHIPAPVYVLRPKEALLLKYACNIYHAAKVVFANEIGVLCERSGVQPSVVMSVFCKDSKLNISSRYLNPGFAFGGSCLPKDIRAVAAAARRLDLELPLIDSLLRSNMEVISRALQCVFTSHVRHVGLIGLSFKPTTDDLRESPYVEIAERLLGKGYRLRIYDPNVSFECLVGSNKRYIDSVLPHLSSLLVDSLDDLADCDLLLVGHHYPGVDLLLARTRAHVIDLAHGVSMPTREEVQLGR